MLLAAGAGACGGDDEKPADTTPTITIETETTPTATETAPTATTRAPAPPPPTPTAPPADPNSGGTTVPRAAPQDGPGNDLPPEPGSPAERFERQCEQNPQTCGD